MIVVPLVALAVAVAAHVRVSRLRYALRMWERLDTVVARRAA
jgi:hypothetical protein